MNNWVGFPVIKPLLFMLLVMALWCPGHHTLLAQETGQWGAGMYANYSIPVSSLSNWFKPAPNVAVSFGRQYNDKWFLEGVLEYARFDRENLKGYPAGKLELSLEHTGILFSGRYKFRQLSVFKPYLNLAGGIFYWKGIRGEVLADSTVIPPVPHIDRKVLQEGNWGLRGGLGVEIRTCSSLSLDLQAFYRLVVGDLWPTLQPNIALEGVSGFQTVNLMAGIRYYFK